MKQLTRKLNNVLDAVKAEALLTNSLLHAYLGRLKALLAEAEVSQAEFTRFVDTVFDALADREALSGPEAATVLQKKMESETCIGYYMPFGEQSTRAAQWAEALPPADRRGYDARAERPARCLKTASFRAFGLPDSVADRHERGLTIDQVKSALRSLRGDIEDYDPEPPTGGRPALV
ncbi:MAG: hypothetical protein HYV27_20010 [Candidatus Hydrogenedentes bacterium]|nr:hypothetical protein [Candidatus Hydrogenedentota bacterium]